MQTRQRRGLGLAAALAAVMATAGLAIAAPGLASAQETDPAMGPVRCTPADYPDLELEPDTGLICAELRLVGGDATFGSVSSTFDEPITIRQVMTLTLSIGPDGIEFHMEPVQEGDGSGPTLPTIEVPGGLLAGTGLEALAPLTHPVTGVSASLLTAGPMSTEGFDLDVLAGGGGGLLTTAHLPLAVRVDNLLLGDSCMIGDEADPIDLELGVVLGEFLGDAPADPDTPLAGSLYELDLSDDAFAIPAADGCGLLGVDSLLEGVGLGALNVFDTAVNNAAGTPAPEEANHVSFHGVFGIAFGG